MNTPLGSDALTAYRLAMNEDGKVLISHMMSVWNIIDYDGRQHHADDLPETMTREGELVIAAEKHEPIRLTFNEIMSETFRLSGKHRAPEDGVWHNLSNVGRVAKRLGVDRAIAEEGLGKTFTQAITRHPNLKTLMAGDNFLVKIKGPEDNLDHVTMQVLCPGDESPRTDKNMKKFGSFSDAYKSIMRISSMFLSNGTKIILTRNDRKVELTYSRKNDGWYHDNETRLRYRDLEETPEHNYKYGELVGAQLGLLRETKTGSIVASVVMPINSEGDNDAYLGIIQTQILPDEKEAMDFLHDIPDIERIFTTIQKYHDRPVWKWLSELPEE